MNGFNKYFENNKKHLSLLTDDNNDVILKYNKICIITEKLVSAEFDSQPVYQEKHQKESKNIWRQRYYKIYRQRNSKRRYSLFMFCFNLYIFSNKISKRKYTQVNLEQCKFRLNKKENIELFRRFKWWIWNWSWMNLMICFLRY